MAEKANKFARKGVVVDTVNETMADASEAKTAKAVAKKTAKAEQAAKPSKPVKAEKAEASQRSDTRKIVLLVKDNPKREGSSAHARYELYRKAKTVADFIEAGGTAGDVRYDAKMGFIELA